MAPVTRHAEGCHCYGGAMAAPILLCTDGSDQAMDALQAGLDLLGRASAYVLVTVADAPDPDVLTGTAHPGSDLSAREFDLAVGKAHESARNVLTAAEEHLGLVEVEVRVITGEPASAICQLAHELQAQAIVIGTHGRGGLTRSLIGSVSDYVVRHAPCSVVVTRTGAAT